MAPFPYDLAVSWRIYPGVSKTPIIYPNDKFRLVEACLRSFVASATGLRVKYFILLDGCPDAYVTLIHEILGNGPDVEILRTPSIGNLPTFAKQVEILSGQTDADYVYFAEDDYLYRPGMFATLLDFLKRGKAEFVTGYCHRDIFTHPIHQPHGALVVDKEQVWIEDCATCMTFLTSKKILEETKQLLLTYSKGNNDCAMWLVLTKSRIYNPLNYIKYFFQHKESYNIMKMSVKYSFKYFFNRKRYRLFVPHPAISTHLEKDLESPGIDWQQLTRDIMQSRA